MPNLPRGTGFILNTSVPLRLLKVFRSIFSRRAKSWTSPLWFRSLEKETLKFEDEEAAEASLSKRYERFTERQKQVEAAWLRKWNDQVAEINQEAEQARLSVLLDIAEKLAAAYPDRQRKPEECLHVVQAEKGDDVKATDYMLALYNEMQGLHAILGCGKSHRSGHDGTAQTSSSQVVVIKATPDTACVSGI